MELHPTYSYFGRGKVKYDGEHEVDLYVNKEFGRVRLHLILDSETEDPSKIPEEINCISGKLINGYEFTLLNCKQLGFFLNFEDKKTMFFFEADFLIEEIIKNEIEPKFNKMSFYIKNALDWGGIYDFSSNRTKLPQGVEERKLIYTSDEFQATYYVWYNKFTVNEDEPFVQSLLNNIESVIEISCSENKPIGYFIDKIKCIIQLIELSTSRKQELNRIEAFCEQTNVEEDVNLDKNRISVLWREQIQLRLKKWCKAISLLPSSLHYATSLQPLKSLSITCKRWLIVSCVHDPFLRGSSKRRERLSMKCVATNHSSF